MKKIKLLLIALNLLLLLIYFHFSIHQKESILKDGQLILLRLAPVDPRSMMQGDYMRLNYEISSIASFYNSNEPKRGYCVVKLDSNGVGQRERLQTKRRPLKKGEFLIEYTKGDWQLNIGAESYFFQEGDSKKYEKAVYGGVRVDKNGNSVLIGLYDKNRQLIQAK